MQILAMRLTYGANFSGEARGRRGYPILFLYCPLSKWVQAFDCLGQMHEERPEGLLEACEAEFTLRISKAFKKDRD